MLILYPDADPFKLVIEVFVAFVQPCPDLLLDVARNKLDVGRLFRTANSNISQIS